MKTIIITQEGQEPYRMQIPNAAKVEIIEEKQEWKKGDVLVSESGKLVLFEIYTNNKNCFSSMWNSSRQDNTDWNTNKFTLATPSQTSEAYSLMQKEGLMWNDSTKSVEKYRWKPEIREEYAYIDEFGAIDTNAWDGDAIDNFRLSIGNVHKPNDTESIEKYKQYLKNY